jgi:hypothetical protein
MRRDDHLAQQARADRADNERRHRQTQRVAWIAVVISGISLAGTFLPSLWPLLRPLWPS